MALLSGGLAALLGGGARGLAAALVLALSAPGASAGDAPGPAEYEVKGAFLYNFAKFVEWPAAALEGRAEFDICVIGAESIERALGGVVDQRHIEGRSVRVRRIGEPDPRCHVLFVTDGQAISAAHLARVASGGTTLIVGESAAFAEQGAMIRFVEVGNKVRFEIDKRSAAAAGLLIRSQLLKLAHSVRE